MLHNSSRATTPLKGGMELGCPFLPSTSLLWKSREWMEEKVQPRAAALGMPQPRHRAGRP